ncbi:MAG: hypothetical protein EA366_13155 [Spirulina sp. DLM2.Bin59]|nr:MAG: hypothetical protein EA366_13155 [Spirulina sp. DLM2.Bin59]
MNPAITNAQINQRLQRLEFLHSLYQQIDHIHHITDEEVRLLEDLRHDLELNEELRAMIDRIFYHLRRKQRHERRSQQRQWAGAA